MNRRVRVTGWIGGATLLLVLGTAPAWAQGERPQAGQPGDASSRGRQPAAANTPGRPGADQGQDPGQEGRGQDQGGPAALRMVPEGWVRIATDTDGDGRFDAVETIYVFDLEQARRSSAGRRQQGGMGQGPGPGQGFGAGPGAGPARPSRVSGTIRNLQAVRLAGMEEEHQLARIETENGRTAKVDLGPTSQLKELNLKEGANVTVTGVRGLINDRPMLLARRVEAGDKSARVILPQDHSLRRVRGKIASTRTAKFRGRDEEAVIAKIRLKTGQNATAILGPKSKLGDLDLKEGDEISVLARPGRLNDHPALVAEQVRAKDRTISIPRPGRKSDFQSRSGGNTGSSD